MNNSCINTFFSSLSSRMWKENDLSDITWAMCQASPTFLECFVHFFFPEVDIHSIIDFVRESPDEQDGGSRVDFLFRVQDDATPYLIEVKINDRNQHFSQYDNAYNVTPDRLGYITNYPLYEEGYDKIRQWEQFYDLMENRVKSFPESEETNLIKGYLSYVKNVCGIIKFTKPMNITGLYSMFELFQILKNLTTRQESDFTLSFYGNNETQNGFNVKFWFEINYPNTSIPKDWGVIGLWYDKEQPIISIGFYKDEGWGKSIYNLLKTKTFTKYQYCSTPYEDGGYYFIDLKEEAMKSIDEASTIDDQKKILCNYMNEALRIPLYSKSL